MIISRAGEATLNGLQATNYFTMEEVELQQSYAWEKLVN